MVLCHVLSPTRHVDPHDNIAGTMLELVKALNDGAGALKASTFNPISLNAGCELFIAFVTLLPHDSAVSTFRLSSFSN